MAQSKPPPAECGKPVELLARIVDQVDHNDFTDVHGQPAQMLKPIAEARDFLAEHGVEAPERSLKPPAGLQMEEVRERRGAVSAVPAPAPRH